MVESLLKLEQPSARPAEVADLEATCMPVARVPAPARFALSRSIWQWLQRWGFRGVLQAKTRRLRVSETVALGEKRFISLIEVDGISFLIGGGSGSVSLLTRLGESPSSHSFERALENAEKDRETA